MSDQDRKSKQIAGIRFLMGIAAESKDVSAKKRDELYDIVETVAYDIRNQQEQQEPKPLTCDGCDNLPSKYGCGMTINTPCRYCARGIMFSDYYKTATEPKGDAT